MSDIISDNELKEIKKIIDILDQDKEIFIETRKHLEKQKITAKKRVKYFEKNKKQ